MNQKEIFALLKEFDDEYIPFSPFISSFNAIEENLTLYREAGLVQHLLILGESGTGKSSLCKLVKSKYPPFELSDRTITPVLIVAIPPMATIASVAESMLLELGDPAPLVGSVSAKTARVIKLCRGCRVELVLFDEAQHIQDRGKVATHYMVGDWLKSLIDEMTIPTVFLGLPRLEQLFQVNEQLRRRFSRRCYLAMGQSDGETIETECYRLFNSLGTCIPLPLSSKPFEWEEFGLRLFYASDGRVSYLKLLLSNALRFCLEKEEPKIEPRILETIFRNVIWSEGDNELNPFNSKFVFRRLDRGGEPFQRGDLTTTRKKRE